MPLTYDQKSEIRMAFDEAYVPSERRRDIRVRHRVDAEISAWTRGRPGRAFHVRIEDFSPGGVGVVHDQPMEQGTEYLIKVPRPGADDLVVLLTVVCCRRLEDGTHWVGMELSSVMHRHSMGQLADALNTRRRLTSRRTKVLFIMLGMFSIGMSMLI